MCFCLAYAWFKLFVFHFYEQGEFKVSERYLTMADLQQALEENRVREMFGSGTACVVSPVGRILYQGEVSLVCFGW